MDRTARSNSNASKKNDARRGSDPRVSPDRQGEFTAFLCDRGLGEDMQALTPTRKHQLELYVKCLTKAQRRIVAAAQLVQVSSAPSEYKFLNSTHVQSIAKKMRERGCVKYSEAFIRLQITQGHMLAELLGKEWR